MSPFQKLSLAAVLLLASSLVKPTFADITCNQGTPNNIQISDINALISNLQTNNISPAVANPFLIASGFSIGQQDEQLFNQQTVSVKVERGNFFVSTHVNMNDVAQALQEWSQVCCGGFSTCIAGSTSVTGDTGAVLPVTIVINT